jgi:DNA polymerase-3 subunit chi
MTRVDFYVLNGNGSNKAAFVCQLAEKAFRLGHKVFILADSPGEAESLDKLLWVFSPGSFVPHALQGEAGEPVAPVILGSKAAPESAGDVLICLKSKAPECAGQFERVAEVVGPTEDDKTLARERFRFYRERGYAIETHTL